ncbi:MULTISPECIES: hypothetical protein [unclassified Streptomyces]|uniref:hypothetical protein n=1 Tax=unclassified Streptomyces TaxID=2593676 RepID=UPI002258633A|nr:MULTISPECIES: hypothetical protein [unclassified Streptomyces]MCX4884133.1 hypothetical protein [Streptomyces sp. NBC_00847]MCX5424251.1 hypothetical protein [Streptomyces sp. NBC_00078]
MRDQEWTRSDDGSFITSQALDFYRSHLPPGFHDAYAAMIRTALTTTTPTSSTSPVPPSTWPPGRPRKKK